MIIPHCSDNKKSLVDASARVFTQFSMVDGEMPPSRRSPSAHGTLFIGLSIFFRHFDSELTYASQ